MSVPLGRDNAEYRTLDITLEITKRCPLSCVFCSSNGGTAHPNELSLNQWKTLIDESIELGAKSFLISGGEPFSSPFFNELTKYISEKPVALSIYTSGNVEKDKELISIPYQDLEYVSDLGPIRMVLSLEGGDASIHEVITKKEGSFKNTLSTIKKCVDLSLKTEVHFVPTKINYEELPRVVTIAHTLGVEKVSVLRFVPQGRGAYNRQNLELDNEELLKLKNIFKSLEQYGNFLRIGSPFNPFLLKKQSMCSAGIDRLTIKYDGLVVPCEAFKFLADLYVEEIDIRKNSLEQIMFNSQIFLDVKNMHKVNWASDCYTCADLLECGGGCPAQKMLRSPLSKTDPYCIKINKNIITFY